MNKVKIVAKGWATYSSALGGILFKDGVSVEALPQATIDRLAACVRIVELTPEGEELPAGSAHRLIQTQKDRAPIAKPMARMSEAERADERRLDLLRSDRVEVIYTGIELEGIVKEKGLKGLRLIGDRWNVKHRAIPVLIELILRAQGDYLAKRNEKIQKISDRAALAVEDAKRSEDERQTKAREQQAKEDAENSVMSGSPNYATEFRVGEIVLSLEAVVEAAWKRSGISLTGWNRAEQIYRDRAIKFELDQISEIYKLPIIPLGEEVPEPVLDEEEVVVEEVVAPPVVVPDAEPVGDHAKLTNGQIDVAGISAIEANLGTVTPKDAE